MILRSPRANKVITIDGPAGSGKSTVSRMVAKRLRWLYLDTGAMYRAVALAAQRRGISPDDGARLGELCAGLDLRFRTEGEQSRLYLNGEDVSEAIRTPEMDLGSSRISAVREVRESMTGLQRRLAESVPLVAEGRDMGTVVFPDARHKFFLTASERVRAERRYRERIARGEDVSLHGVESELALRDRQDASRIHAPLRPADDAVVIDSTALSPEEVLTEILRRIGESTVK
jgi:cytidylate kinase